MKRALVEWLLAALLCGAAALPWSRYDDPTPALADRDPEIRRGAVRALGERGVAAAFAVQALVPLLADASTAAAAAFALGEIGPAAAAAVPALAACAARPDPMVRARAAFALARIAPENPQARAAIDAVQASPEPLVRKLASPR